MFMPTATWAGATGVQHKEGNGEGRESDHSDFEHDLLLRFAESFNLDN